MATPNTALTTLQQVAQNLGVSQYWLWSLIKFESNADPAARNSVTGARGLIQFLNSTAKSLGYDSADDLYNKNPSFDSQMNGPVYDYLKQYKPFPTKQSLYMAVFYPAARSWSPDTVFPDAVRKANPGIDTVQDYIDHVEHVKIVKKAIDIIKPIAIVAALAGIAYLIAKKGNTL